MTARRASLGRSVRVASWALLLVMALAVLLPARALACSPPFERPTIAALGPAQVVVVGTIGERVAGGRLFHVERSYNGGVTATPIVIAFKEGEPVGDCSYPVSTGANLIIAPYREANGRLLADLSTLQADPASDDGRRYVAEAEALFGAGVALPPASVEPVVQPADDVRLPLVVFAVGVGVVVAVILIGRRQPRPT